jgi:hypothetical protein
VTSAPSAPLLSAVLLFWFVQSWNLAGEWLIGGIEAKGFAYPLVFLALANIVQRRWWVVWPLLGMASSFHILVGGWAVIASLCAWMVRRRDDQLGLGELLTWLLLGGLFALPGLVPALQLMSKATPADLQEASRIYTFRRLAHHLVFQRFSWWCIARFAVLTLAWCYAATKVAAPSDRLRRLNAVVLGSVIIAVLGIAIDFATGPFLNLRASILRYYWFRLSDILVPVGLAVSSASTLLDTSNVSGRMRHRCTWHAPLVALVSLGVLAIVWSSVRSGFLARPLALQQQSWNAWFEQEFEPSYVDGQWREACAWIRAHAPEEVVFLAPVRQQTFKWYAQRPEVVTWKDVPQDAAGLLDWWQRRKEIYALPARPWEDNVEFMNLVNSYRVTHVVWPNSKEASEPSVPGRRVFRNRLFSVYQL